MLDQAKGPLVLRVAISSCLGKNAEVGQMSGDHALNALPLSSCLAFRNFLNWKRSLFMVFSMNSCFCPVSVVLLSLGSLKPSSICRVLWQSASFCYNSWEDAALLILNLHMTSVWYMLASCTGSEQSWFLITFSDPFSFFKYPLNKIHTLLLTSFWVEWSKTIELFLM